MPLPPREYSGRLGVLTGEQLQAAADRFDLGRVLAAEPAETGLFGQNVLLETDRGGFVLRGCPHTDWQLRQEAHFAERLHEATDVPAPWPYRVEERPELFGWPFAVMPRLPGTPPQALWPDLTEADREAIASAMGDALARLQRLEGPGYGTWDPVADRVVTTDDFEAFSVARLREQLEEAAGIEGALDAEDLAFVEAAIDAHAHAFAEAPPPVFLHADYAPGNVTVERADGWLVRGVFDLQMAGYGDGEEDLVRLVGIFRANAPGCIGPFVDAYRSRRPLRPGAGERFRLYTLRDRLILWNYGKRHGLWFGEEASFAGFVRYFMDAEPYGAG